MKSKQLLLECKKKLNIESDYALANKIGIAKQRMHELMKGKAKANAYTIFRMSKILERNPIDLIAEIYGEKEGREGLFFKEFQKQKELFHH